MIAEQCKQSSFHLAYGVSDSRNSQVFPFEQWEEPPKANAREAKPQAHQATLTIFKPLHQEPSFK